MGLRGGADNVVAGTTHTTTQCRKVIMGTIDTTTHTTSRDGWLSPASSSGRVRLAALILALLPVALWWAERAVDAPANGWFEGTTTFAVGSDFSVFYTAGTMVASGDAAHLYDADVFRQVYRDTVPGSPSDNSTFGNTPAFAVLVAPFTALSFEAAWLAWTVVGLAAFGLALRLLEVPRPLLAGVMALLTLPVYFAITFGQGTLLWLAILAGVFAALRVDRPAVAGAIAGLLILKPTVALGLALWWLIDPRRRRALWAALASAGAVVVATLPVAGATWLDYPRAALDFGARHRALDAQWAQFSPWGFFDLLLPGHRAVASALGALAAAAGIAGLVWFWRRHRDDWRLMFAAAVVVTLWISPQVVAYEWTLLLAAGAALWQARPDQRDLWFWAGIALATASVWSILLSNEMRPALGWAFQFAVPVFLASAVVAARRLDAGTPAGEVRRSAAPT